MELTRAGRFVDEPVPNLCNWIAQPEVPSPAGGTVVAVCAALASALAELILRVTAKRMSGEQAEHVAQWLSEAGKLRADLLTHGEGDVYEAARIITGDRAACVRKDIGSPAKIAGTCVKLLRLTAAVAPDVPAHLHSDLRVVAFLGHAAVHAITEIALANIQSGGGGDDTLLERLAAWRRQADDYKAQLLTTT